MQTVLLSSGYHPETLARLRERWNVVDIPEPGEALEYLERCREYPLAVAIGFVQRVDGQDAVLHETLPAPVMLSKILELDSDLPVVVSASEAHARAIVNIVQQGAFGYVVEPSDEADPEAWERHTSELALALSRATRWRRTILENRRLKRAMQAEAARPSLIACSSSMERVRQLVAKVARTPVTVLITGESGTGKELIARRIHETSDRAERPFVAINCGALSETLLTSELFGHVKGAFTSADANRPGVLQQAGEGTLFLDEIGSISEAAQAMLLRVLEQRVARPVGAQTEYPVRCRFIAAVNRPLEAMVMANTFREDLFYRLNVFHVELSPLRSRREDVPLLANHFLTRIAQEYGRDIDRIEPAAMDLLEGHDWPGNVRELRNVIERAVVMCETRRITAANLAGYLKQRRRTVGVKPSQTYDEAMRDYESKLLRTALANSAGNLAEAARALGMNRTTLSYRVNRLNLKTD